MAGLAKALCTWFGRTTPVISSTAAPVSATTSERSLSQIRAATTAARTSRVIAWGDRNAVTRETAWQQSAGQGKGVVR